MWSGARRVVTRSGICALARYALSSGTSARLVRNRRSIFQIIDRYDEAPIAFTLSAVAAAVYVVATLALAFGWDRVAWVTISFELVGVLVIGTISLVAPSALGLDEINPFGREATVWSVYGAGYLFIPLALPILGILWLRSKRTETVSA